MVLGECSSEGFNGGRMKRRNGGPAVNDETFKRGPARLVESEPSMSEGSMGGEGH